MGRNQNPFASFLPRLIVAVALLPSWLGLAGSWHWVLDLCAHFRWQYLFIGLAAIAWSAWRRHGVLLALAVMTTLLNGVLVGALAWNPGMRQIPLEQDFSLHVLSLNVLASNADKPAVIDHLANSGADLLFLAEVDAGWAQALAALEGVYPHRVLHARADNFGVALLSRIPLTDARVVALTHESRPSIVADIRHDGRQLLFVGTHPPPPLGARLAGIRDRQIAALGDLVAQRDRPAIVVGDFNATPWSAPMRAVMSRGLGFRSTEPAWRPTWKSRSPLAIPIDHILVTAPLVVSGRVPGPHVGSDHLPVEARIRWAAGANAGLD